jgi:hypothetical protein
MGQEGTHAEAKCIDLTSWRCRRASNGLSRRNDTLLGLSLGVPRGGLQENSLAE